MKLKDKIILVHYIGVADLSDAHIREYVNEIIKNVGHEDDESVEEFFVPIVESRDTRIECINPVVVSEEKYAEVEKRLVELQEKMTEAIENFSKK